jgi:hypothetical protein
MFNGLHSKLTRHTFALWNRNSMLQISSKPSAELNALPRMGYRLHLLHLVPVAGAARLSGFERFFYVALYGLIGAAKVVA